MSRWGSSPSSEALSAAFDSPAPGWASLTAPVTIPHRGGALQVPEHTMEGYRIAVGQGFPMIEQDVHVLADGGLAVMHDATVDRMTTSAGNVADHTTVSWKQLSVDASAILGGGWPDGLRPALLEEVLAEFGNRVLLCIEAKGVDSMGPTIDALERRGIHKGTVLLQSFSLSDCQLAVSRGWPGVVLLGTTDYTTAAAEGIEWIGPSYGQINSGVCTGAHAVGVKVACYTLNRRLDRDNVIATGADALFTDDPVYIAGTKADRKTDLFARQTWMPGQQANNGNRGVFFAADSAWGYDDSVIALGYVGSLHGYLRPTSTTSFVLDFDMAITATNGSDLTRWGGIFIGTNDYTFSDQGGLPDQNGYHFLLRREGRIGVYRVAPNTTTALLGELSAAAGTDLVLGAYTPYRITVTPTQLTVARRDLPAETLTITDAAARGGYISLGRNQASVRFKNVSVT